MFGPMFLGLFVGMFVLAAGVPRCARPIIPKWIVIAMVSLRVALDLAGVSRGAVDRTSPGWLPRARASRRHPADAPGTNGVRHCGEGLTRPPHGLPPSQTS